MADKSQLVRLIDVFLLGPFMVWYALKSRGIPDAARKLLLAAGVATILYNGRNYVLNR